MRDVILSTIESAPTSHFVYSSLSFHGREHGWELPGPWFVRALTPLGVAEDAIRQTLYRMEREGALVSRTDGRAKVYRPTATTRAIIDAGTAKMLAPTEPAWDGAWTVVHFRFDGGTRQQRDRLRDVLRVEGCGHLGPGLYVHPRDRSARIREATADWKVEARLQVFRGPRSGGLDDRAFAASIWDLDETARRYRDFVAAFGTLTRRRVWLPAEAAAARFALVFAFLETAWHDPELAPELLPRHWPGDRARALVAKLYRRLTPAARAFGEAVLTEVGSPRRSGLRPRAVR